VVVLFHDHGSRYVGKFFNDDWMRDRGFLEEENKYASDLIKNHRDLPLVTCEGEELVSHAVAKMKKYNISQIPVVSLGEFIGFVDDTHLFQALVEDTAYINKPLSSVMNPPLPIVEQNTKLEDISKLISKEVPAVMVHLSDKKFHIITRHDLIQAMA
jgi:cystathionine beta-synthase